MNPIADNEQDDDDLCPACGESACSCPVPCPICGNPDDMQCQCPLPF